jgi:hypothetical protein
MLIAVADVIAAKGYNVAKSAFIVATDISAICFHMAFIQLHLYGVAAKVVHGNSLTLETFDIAITGGMYEFIEADLERRKRIPNATGISNGKRQRKGGDNSCRDMQKTRAGLRSSIAVAARGAGRK